MIAVLNKYLFIAAKLSCLSSKVLLGCLGNFCSLLRCRLRLFFYQIKIRLSLALNILNYRLCLTLNIFNYRLCLLKIGLCLLDIWLRSICNFLCKFSDSFFCCLVSHCMSSSRDRMIGHITLQFTFFVSFSQNITQSHEG